MNRVLVRRALTAVVAVAGIVVIAPPAQAATIDAVSHVNAPVSSTRVAVAVRFASDVAPVTCRIIAKDLEAFGRVGATARVFTTTRGELEGVFSFPVGHDVEIFYSCTNRLGDTKSSTFVADR